MQITDFIYKMKFYWLVKKQSENNQYFVSLGGLERLSESGYISDYLTLLMDYQCNVYYTKTLLDWTISSNFSGRFLNCFKQ